MTTEIAPARNKDRSRGRGYLWAGIGLAILGIAATILQYQIKLLVVPWELAIFSTVGVVLVLISLKRRRTVVRFIAMLLLGSLAGFESYFLISLSRLPAYSGPLAGQKLPDFETTLANGQAFSQEDLADGTPTVVTFFRGRW